MITLNLKITTKTNLYIGGMALGFEIGGIDMVTAIRNNKPYIPASSFKGALREICRDHADEASEITGIYKDYSDPQDENAPKHLFIFGVPGQNRTPKLIFNDFECISEGSDLFSIETKNSIEESEGKLNSNPRTYKVANAGLIFEGKILFRLENMEKNEQEIVKNYIQNMCEKFNDGLYRIGNSKSRGYGYISVDVSEETKE